MTKEDNDPRKISKNIKILYYFILIISVTSVTLTLHMYKRRYLCVYNYIDLERDLDRAKLQNPFLLVFVIFS